MNSHSRPRFALAASAAIFLLAAGASAWIARPPLLRAQAGESQQRLADLKDSAAKNKAEIAHYTWTETVTISLKGEQKKVQHYQVIIGPDGKPVKTSTDPAPQAQDSGSARGGRFKQRIVEKKKEEYEDYAEQMKNLAAQYLPPEKDLIQAAYAKGNVSFAPTPGIPAQIKIVIHSYYKPNDSVTILFDKTQKLIQSISIASYLSDPSDVMNLDVVFERIPAGPSHVATVRIDGVSKQLLLVTQNSNYVKQY